MDSWVITYKRVKYTILKIFPLILVFNTYSWVIYTILLYYILTSVTTSHF